MRKLITKKWLQSKEACSEGIEWGQEQKERESLKIIDILICKKKYDWAIWLIVKLMNYSQYSSYAIYAAEQVLSIYEKIYPDDNRPRKAIKVAKCCIENPTQKNKIAACDAAFDAACSARNVARIAFDISTTYVIKKVVTEAAFSASSAAYTAPGNNTENAAYDAIHNAIHAATAEIKTKILEYGIKKLKEL